MRELLNSYGRRREPCLFVIDFENRFPFVCDLERAAAEGVLYSIRGSGNAPPPEILGKPVKFEKRPVSLETYSRSFFHIKDELRKGNTYLVNLTFPTPVETNLTLREMFDHSRAPYKLFFKNRFVVFSPEEFVTVRGTEIVTRPMKGTIDASLPRAAERVLADEKEKAEHVTVVDLLRNDLGMVAGRVRVRRWRYIDEVRTQAGRLLQVSTEIAGQLDPAWRDRLGDMLSLLLPAGSVTGAPKAKTVEIIKRAEPYERGYYTGIFGLFDGSDLSSGVMIRYIERDAAGGLVYKSGGGITIDSDPVAEYREMVDKVYVPIAGDD
jgi:para-aminobenzoate synthetase component 1